MNYSELPNLCLLHPEDSIEAVAPKLTHRDCLIQNTMQGSSPQDNREVASPQKTPQAASPQDTRKQTGVNLSLKMSKRDLPTLIANKKKFKKY